MKHAYLIIAHSGWDQLKELVSVLDDKRNDIFIHIDKKAKNVPIDEIKLEVNISNIEIYQEYKVYWGSFELIQTELFLFKKAKVKEYDYYHLLSGADFPIKSNEFINSFFEANKGKEFVHYDTEERLIKDHEIGRRTRLYHFLQNYRRRYKYKVLNTLFTLLERSLLLIQILFKVDRMRKHKEVTIKYGSQWVSITNELVNYLISKEQIIYEIFKYTNCADELFIQTIVYNSIFKERLYDKNYDDSVMANMRLIDIKKRGNNGNPYIWKMNDFEEIKNSPCLWVRKFSYDVDKNIINAIKKLY